MNFAERAPSNEWTALSHVGEDVAEAWFKPEEDPLALLLRVPQERFQVEDLTRRLTLEDLLTAAEISNEEVESWQVGEEFHPGSDGNNPELKRLLPAPVPEESYLAVFVRLKPPAPPVADVAERTDEDETAARWQTLEAKWKAILGIEAGIELLRVSIDGLRSEMESEFRKTLNVEHKVHALQADVANWNRAKSRIHYSLPKVREFIHRATWALGVPERKRLDDVHRNHIEPRVPFPEMDQVREQLDHLQKDRQVLAAHGSAVSQECRAILGEIQRALSTLQRNATENSRRKRSAGKEKGKHF